MIGKMILLLKLENLKGIANVGLKDVCSCYLRLVLCDVDNINLISESFLGLFIPRRRATLEKLRLDRLKLLVEKLRFSQDSVRFC